jgi:hypothetical protein
MKKIAIQGHVTRGKDIIKILENLGGKNMFNCDGYNVALFYYIDSNGFINCNFSKGMHEGYEYYTLEDYEQQLLNTMENKRTIKIDLTTAREWYKQGGDLRKIALQAFSEKELKALPSSWEEYCEINPYLDKDKDVYLHANGTVTAVSQSYFRLAMSFTMPSEKRAKQFVILNKLLQIRDYYNQGWEPDWSNVKQEKYIIGYSHNKLFLDVFLNLSHIFAFKTREIRDTFFKNFKKDLEFIKEFL